MQTTSERAEIEVGGGRMGAYVACPDAAGRWPAVLLFMEIFGINAHIRSVCDRVAAEGYVVMAPDLFHRTGPGVELGYDEAGLARGIELMSATTASEVISDVSAALSVVKARPDVGGRGVGAMGFCFGGHVAYLSACELPIAATASFYGGGIAVGAPGNEQPPTVGRSDKIKGRMLCLFGENDAYIPLDQVKKIETALEDAGIRHEAKVYPGVGHGFFCDARADFDKASADDAWKKLTRLFKDELG
ncbi:MAG: dienelactone hydrolase family protein [Myxococcales bacterium]|nr:MAG: dienelactone hydrolase family protein [Myxococcales bacterium]